MDKEYDYIIIGAGSAGCVLANRLSASGEHEALLIEAGGRDSNYLFRLPMLMGKLMHSGIYNWGYHTQPEAHLDGRQVYWPRGKALGGSSTINGMIYVRGNPADYDGWAAAGNPGWSYAEVLPWFKRSERHEDRSDGYHGNHGELSVRRARGENAMFDAYVEAGVQAGYGFTDDFNGDCQEGFGRYDFTIERGKRCSAARAFLHPVTKRRNLTVAANALVHRILIESDAAVGVQYRADAHKRSGSRLLTARAAKEVLLCAGVVNSPQLLMLSGIGDSEALESHGIAPVRHLPGVGKNVQDHVDCCLVHACRAPVSIRNNLRVDRVALSVAEAALFGTGFVTSFPYEAGSFMRSSTALAAPDIQTHFMPATEETANLHWSLMSSGGSGNIGKEHGITIRIGPTQPSSRGQIALRSANPEDAPLIFANYLESQGDAETMMAGVEMMREVMAAKVLGGVLGEELAPGPAISTRAQMRRWLVDAAMTTLHPVGSCRMGAGADAVVDAELRVHGVERLRVVDASIMPTITRGNTNAPAIMIAEKAADLILNPPAGASAAGIKPGASP